MMMQRDLNASQVGPLVGFDVPQSAFISPGLSQEAFVVAAKTVRRQITPSVLEQFAK